MVHLMISGVLVLYFCLFGFWKAFALVLIEIYFSVMERAVLGHFGLFRLSRPLIGALRGRGLYYMAE